MTDRIKFHTEITCPFCGHINPRLVKMVIEDPKVMIVVCCDDNPDLGCGKLFAVGFVISIETKIYTLKEYIDQPF